MVRPKSSFNRVQVSARTASGSLKFTLEERHMAERVTVSTHILHLDNKLIQTDSGKTERDNIHMLIMIRCVCAKLQLVLWANNEI